MFFSPDAAENRSCQLVGDQLTEIKDKPKMCSQNALLFTPPRLPAPGMLLAADRGMRQQFSRTDLARVDGSVLPTTSHQERPAGQVQTNAPFEECLQYLINYKAKWPLSLLELSSVHSVLPCEPSKGRNQIKQLEV